MNKCLQKFFVLILTLAPIFFLSAQPASSSRQSPGTVSLLSELQSFLNIDNLPVYRDQTTIGQISSYDTTGGNDDGFSGKYSFIRKISDNKLVIFDRQGPGVINRIWTPTPSNDSLDFYIDDTTRPAFTIKYRDLFSGKVFPFVAPLCNNQLGGYYCYLPIAFSKRCMIIYRGKTTQFHQIGYRLYPKGTQIKNFSLQLSDEEKSTLGLIETFCNKKSKTAADFSSEKINTYRKEAQLNPGQSLALLHVNKGGRIAGIELEPASAFEGESKNIDIKITWDNEKFPAVYCPIADFFGYAFGKKSMESLLLGTTGETNYCYFPMPFDKAAKIELLYRNDNETDKAGPVTIKAKFSISDKVRDPKTEGKLYTYWNNQKSVPINQPHEFLSVSGKGHYVGSLLLSQGLQSGMTNFFEGDDSTSVDGHHTMHGTGSEDYFNGGWYALMNRWDGPFSMPLSGALDYSLVFSRTGGYRFFLSDKIPFTKNFYHSIEHGGEHNQRPGAYTSLALYYADGPAKESARPNSSETRMILPDTLMIYPQLMFYNSGGEITVQPRGETFIFTAPREADIRIALDEVPHGKYKVLFDYNKLPQGCSFSLWQRQTALTDYFDGYAAEPSRQRSAHLTDLTITPLNHTLTIHLKADGEKKQFVLNRIILIKVR